MKFRDFNFFTSTSEAIEHNSENPDDPMITGHLGINPAKLSYRIKQAKSMIAELAERAQSAGPAEWRVIAHHMKELEMNIEQIRHAYEEMDKKYFGESIYEDWQKANRKDRTPGMSKKAVKAYRRENPGSKLSTAVTTKPSKLKKGSKAAKRRKSFCARMKGMKKAHASAKTKRDPNSPINKSLRRWHCESIEEMRDMIINAEQKITALKEAANPAQQAAIAINMKKKDKKPHNVEESEKRMSRAAKGYEKYGKQGMMALAKAGRDGASEKELDTIRDKHDKYNESWSDKYKKSINCSHPKGFSQRAHCAGKKKHNEDTMMEMVCPECGMCKTHGNLNEIKKGQKDSNGVTKCWPGYQAKGTKTGRNGGQVRNCVKVDEESKDSEVKEAKKKTLRNTNPCWKGYHPVGTKEKNGRTVPNCVPVDESYENELRRLIKILESK